MNKKRMILSWSAATALALAPALVTAQQPVTRYGIAPPLLSTTTTPVALLSEEPAARAIVDRLAPGLLANPNLPRSRTLTLADIQPFASGVLTAPVLAAIDGELAKLPPSALARRQADTAIAEIERARLDPAAPWITHPAAFAADFARQPLALQYRRELTLGARPTRFPARISADQRFILYVNGARVASGPARGDLAHYRYERIDLAPHMRAGRNVLAAEVWSDGKSAPVATISAGHTGFMVKGESTAAAVADTGPAWRVRVDASRTVSSARAQINAIGGYYAAGAPETLRADAMAPDWLAGSSTSSDWTAAVPAVTQGERQRVLVPDALPQMRYAPVAAGKVVRVTGVAAGAFPTGAVTIPANSEARILIDAGRVMAAFPTLVTSRGAGAQVTITYTEALYDPIARGERGGRVRFTDRARVDNGDALGLTDTIVPDGGVGQRFEPFWWRAWRFAEIRVKTGAAPLTLDRFEAHETGYPFTQQAYFDSDDQDLNAIWRTGYATARFDAHETYMDTAYWEQLQYVGDTRLQALISYDVTGDPRLAVQALDAFDASRVVDGLPQSSWPISSANPIPPFALLWIGMLHDYWERQPDKAPLARNLAGMRAVLDWYRPYVEADGIVGGHPGWLFVDWKDGLDGGGPGNRKGEKEESCVISLLRLGALREAADLERAVGDPARATDDLAAAALAARGIQDRCWDAQRRLYANTPAKDAFSQHANALAVLYDVAPAAQARAILDRVMAPGGGIDAPGGITGTTYYFSYYLAKALDHAGLGDRYLGLLANWRAMLKQHFTTWPENPDPTRSDSHAWSAHPTSGLLTYVAGIEPAAPGFARVRVAPHLGGLKSLRAGMASPAGLIRTDYRIEGRTLRAVIDLPAGLSGTFVFAGKETPLATGRNMMTVPLPSAPPSANR